MTWYPLDVGSTVHGLGSVAKACGEDSCAGRNGPLWGYGHRVGAHGRKEFFGPLGVTNIRTFVDPQNPARVAVMMDVPDLDASKTAMQSKVASDAMAFDGVVPESLVILVESKGNRL